MLAQYAIAGVTPSDPDSMTALMILATLLSPVVAVLVTLWMQSRKEKRDTKRFVFTTLMATRHTPVLDETVRALNVIDVVFHRDREVKRLWREYFDMLGNPSYNGPEGYKQRQVKNLEMLAAMAKAVGYGGTVSHLDVDRVYYPEGLGQQAKRTQEISDEMLRVLKGSQGFLVAPREAATQPALDREELDGNNSRAHSTAPLQGT